MFTLGRQAEEGHRLAGDIASIHHTRAGGNSQELIIGGEILEARLEPTITPVGGREVPYPLGHTSRQSWENVRDT